jgi:hypothetical protein
MPRGRPPKDPSLRMDTDLRIPITAEQKMLIAKAAAKDGEDMAAWIRPIIVRAAQNKLRTSGDGPFRKR